jgi:hypothetical protein
MFWQRFVSVLSNPVTWKGLFYLIMKLPFGTLNFSVLVSLGSLSLALIAAPFYYSSIHPVISLGQGDLMSLWQIDSLTKAMVVCLLGVFFTLISMHLLNTLAKLNGIFARAMLGNSALKPAAPVQPPLPPEDNQPAAGTGAAV